MYQMHAHTNSTERSDIVHTVAITLPRDLQLVVIQRLTVVVSGGRCDLLLHTASHLLYAGKWAGSLSVISSDNGDGERRR